jgi:hypothetical protein
MRTKSSISNHQKVDNYCTDHILEIQITPIKEMKKVIMKITAIVVKMIVLTKIMENTMVKLTMRMALLCLQVHFLHQNKLILKLKNLKRRGTLNYLENLAIPILQLVLDTIW